STVIGYQLSVSGKVILKVYNMLGKEIRTLVNEKQTAGTHSIVWDGTDDSGNPISCGIYFYRIKTDNVNKTGKMLLLR
ncbi:MAG: T9SS type A sorting domain-containing protein, partial [Bacteroidales bacterium]|nr:T9SS type A sorting domain-containing protein [Bacteroidales bacterium]